MERSQAFEPVMTYPTPVGWNPDGTYTGNPGRYIGHADEWDLCRSRNPYPLAMPNLNAPTDPFKVDRHFRALAAYEKQVHEDRIKLEAGDYSVLPTLKQCVKRLVALKEELSSTVSIPDDALNAILNLSSEGGLSHGPVVA